MKDGAFAALQTDELPLPDIEEVVGNLEISPHAKDRFLQRTRARQLLLADIREGSVSRLSPTWRAEEDFEHSLDLYLVFPFFWEDGGEDEGCLLLEKRDDKYVAKTFVSRSSNDAERAPKLPPVPSSLLKKIAKATRQSEKEVSAFIEKLPICTKPPVWLQQEADAWIDGGSWAISLRQELVGAQNPYHYSWLEVFIKHAERKRLARERHQRRRHRKNKF